MQTCSLRSDLRILALRVITFFAFSSFLLLPGIAVAQTPTITSLSPISGPANTSVTTHSVRKAGGTVLHKSPATEKLAFDSLVQARRVLMKLYKA
jgi:hypothetical protein